MKRVFSSFLQVVSFLAVLGVACGQTKERFPLMAWDYVEAPATLEAMRDCGITSVAFARPKTLDACQKFGIQAIVFDESVARSGYTSFDGDKASLALVELIKRVGKHPAVMGYHLKDEPKAAEFPELAKAVATVKALAPGKWPYVNLYPDIGQNWEKYVQDFLTILKPTALSYDRYVLVGDEFRPTFWSHLAYVREAGLKHNLPFWNIILTSTHWNYRDISQADLRLQVWGSLVYGVKGIGYYKFSSKELPILDAPDLGNFRDGPLDQFGEKTQSWYWLRNLNRQVHNLAPTLLHLHSDATYHIGGEVPARNVGPSEKTLIRSMGEGEYVVGDFTHQDGKRYVMLVNKSLKQSFPVRPQFNTAPKSVNVVSAITGELRPLTKYFWLAPGQGVLLQVN